jgi:drug/metabolite transporter (DMT)-like permease
VVVLLRARSASRHRLAIWLFALGYFACYVPYSALTKALSDGLLPGMPAGIPGLELLPIVNLASLVGMFAFLSAAGWWRHASHRRIFGLSLPVPGRWTFLSGVCTAAIIATTTLAYTFSGVSIVFMMLLMRGGVLVIAPIVDFVSKRHVAWLSRVALGLSLAAVLVPFFGRSQSSLAITWIALADVVIYLLAYFVRLRFMTKLGKSDDPDSSKRYFVEEQMTATPLVVAVLILLAFVGGPTFSQIRSGFTTLPSSGYLGLLVIAGLMSQGTGIFGGLILLDRRENSFCVPVNRAGSVLAGIVASLALGYLVGAAPPTGFELGGAALVVLAVVALGWPRSPKFRELT